MSKNSSPKPRLRRHDIAAQPNLSLKILTLVVTCPGDRSAGIHDYLLTITIPRTDEVMEDEYRESLRKAANVLGEAVTGDACACVFSDECPNCCTVFAEDPSESLCRPLCPNPLCPSNVPKES